MCEMPEIFYLKTSKTNRNKINKCARYFKYKKTICIYTSDVYNGELRHILQLDEPNYTDINIF